MGEQRANDVSRDGRYLLYGSGGRGTSGDLHALSLADGKTLTIGRTPARERASRLSPDGRFVVYMSDTSGRDEAYLLPFLRPGIPHQLSIAGAQYPKWSADGRSIFFLTNDRTIMRLSFDGAAAGEPQAVFTSPNKLGNYEPLPGGRFLLIAVDEEAETLPARMIVRWPDTVR